MALKLYVWACRILGLRCEAMILNKRCTLKQEISRRFVQVPLHALGHTCRCVVAKRIPRVQTCQRRDWSAALDNIIKHFTVKTEGRSMLFGASDCKAEPETWRYHECEASHTECHTVPPCSPPECDTPAGPSPATADNLPTVDVLATADILATLRSESPTTSPAPTEQVEVPTEQEEVRPH